MNASSWEMAKQIFDEAREISWADRPTFLDNKCAGNAELRAEVEKLLASYDSGFLEETVLGAVEALVKPSLADGQVIGRYRIGKMIGSGGMGQVFLGEDMELGRPVAFKVLHYDVGADDERLRRFVQEARAASALNHPNILTIHEIGSFEGFHFIVSEYVDGETLRERKRLGLNTQESIEITCQIAAALKAAHAAGIVHRDIKPENIMLRRDGLVKVLDFGLAKLTEADDRPIAPSAPASAVHTSPGLVMGTAGYMSPEQALGQAVDARTDLWSLGVVLHEMLTGKSPFEGETVSQLISSILRTNDSEELNTDIPTELQPICRKALAKDKDSRYRSAHDLLTDLEGEKKRMEYATQSGRYVTVSTSDELNTQLIRPQPTLSAEYIVTSVKRHKYATAGAIMLIATAALAFGVYRFDGATPRTSDGRPSAAIDANTTEKDLDISRLPSSGRVFKVAVSPDGGFAAYTTGLSENSAALHVTELSTKKDVQVVPAPSVKNAQIDNLVFSPDSSHVIYRHVSWETEEVFMVPVGGGRPEKIHFAFRAASFSPDGKRIAYHRSLNDEKAKRWLGYDLVLADFDGRNERVLLHNLDEREDFLWLGVPQWSNDGKWIAAWDHDRTGNHFHSLYFPREKFSSKIYAVNTEDGSRQAFSDQQFSDISGVTWTPDGNILVAGKEVGAQRHTPSQLWLLTKTTAKRITNDPHGFNELSATRDGGVLMTTQRIERNDLWMLNGNDATTARQVTHSGEVGGGFASLPDGGVLVVSRINHNMSLWRMNTDGSGRKQLRSDEGTTNTNPRATRDGRYILFTSAPIGGDNSILRINSNGSEPTRLVEKATLIDISADDRWAYYHHLEGKQRVISKVPIGGGPSVVVARLDRPWQRYAISHLDGRIAEVYNSPTGETSGGIRIYSPNGMELRNIPSTTIADNALIHWTPDGKGIAYVDTRDNRSNVWVIDANGKGSANRLTNFTSPTTQAFTFSWDGKRTFVTRPVRTSDALLIRRRKE